MTKTKITAAKLANTDQAVEDLELTPLDYRMLGLMVKLADGDTGICRRAQTDLAKRLGIHARTVQRRLDHLVDRKYLKSIGQARKGYIQAYQVFKSEEVTPAPYLTPEATSAREHTTPVSAHTTPASRSYGAPTVHVPLVSPSILPSAANSNTEPAGLAAPLKALGPPFGEFDADLRHRLGDRIKWLAMMRLVERSGDTVTLSALTSHQADNARAHCEAEILAASGAGRLAFQVAINTANPFLTRRVAS